jgi:putative transposase
VFATKRRDRRAALEFLKRALKRYGWPRTIVTDRIRSYGAATKAPGIAGRRECGRWLNSRAESSHQPFRRQESAMAKFRDIRTLQKFAAVHASIHNHFNLDRHLNQRAIFKDNRSAALAESRAAKPIRPWRAAGRAWSAPDRARRRAGNNVRSEPPQPTLFPEH